MALKWLIPFVLYALVYFSGTIVIQGSKSHHWTCQAVITFFFKQEEVPRAHTDGIALGDNEGL